TVEKKSDKSVFEEVGELAGKKHFLIIKKSINKVNKIKQFFHFKPGEVLSSFVTLANSKRLKHRLYKVKTTSLINFKYKSIDHLQKKSKKIKNRLANNSHFFLHLNVIRLTTMFATTMFHKSTIITIYLKK
ncbi:hypothetical protein BpHYR1_053871, partial [Brachionus plicatilis]